MLCKMKSKLHILLIITIATSLNTTNFPHAILSLSFTVTTPNPNHTATLTSPHLTAQHNTSIHPSSN
ncbi:hypothetical protein K469DRAFT_373173 [Zopfia rhizophila CBS 207.26]|uniref:Uncharacterized protein n=1 Tax=Zopfia rhizophila CBS 207.26 TaxID=1314779 RepID=A0A6A6ELC3_9PEZI|nr:hypothetical protein K469DRAFT_373173 [Zopfia rhizophila CBS 207.26]